MTRRSGWPVRLGAAALISLVSSLVSGCRPQQSAPTASPAGPPISASEPAGRPSPKPQKPPPGQGRAKAPPGPGRLAAGGASGPATPQQPAGSQPAAVPTQFDGISLTPPAGWEAAAPADAGPMAPVALFRLPAADGQAELEVRLTHFPDMKTIPLQANLNRWYGQFTQPDGRPTAEVAKVETWEAGGATITVVDVTGTMAGGGGQGLLNYRLLAAVIDHPRGPHFLKVVGPEASVAKWRESVLDYLKSAKVTQ